MPLVGRVTRFPLDLRWQSVCEDDFVLMGAPNGDRPFPVCGRIEAGHVELTGWPLGLRPRTVDFVLMATRKGFLAWDMPERTLRQKRAADRSNRLTYPRRKGQM